jgi:hypothetical protein
MYGCETWSMTEMDEVLLNKRGRKLHRAIYAPVTEQEVCGTRSNEEVSELAMRNLRSGTISLLICGQFFPVLLAVHIFIVICSICVPSSFPPSSSPFPLNPVL